MGEKSNVYTLMVGKPEGKRPLGRPRRRWIDNIKMDLLEIGLSVVDWIGLAQDKRTISGTTVTNQNLIQKEIKGKLNSGNACYHSVQNLLSLCLLLKNVKIIIYSTKIMPVVLYGCETWYQTLREEHRL
jgi:hypothetical protein